MKKILKRTYDNLKKRAMSAGDIEWELYTKNRIRGLDASYPNFYLGDSENYLIYVDRGKLFKVSVSISGGISDFGEHEEIFIEHIPVERSNIVFKRSKEGLKFIAVAGTATINRDYQIDSTSLFDSMVEKFDPENNEYIVNFYHEIDDEDYHMGNVKHLARHNNLLVACGIIDETTLFGRGAAENLVSEQETDSEDKWGTSIEFYPHKYEELDFEGVTIRSHIEGEFHGLAILLEKDASHYFTSINGEN